VEGLLYSSLTLGRTGTVSENERNRDISPKRSGRKSPSSKTNTPKIRSVLPFVFSVFSRILPPLILVQRVTTIGGKIRFLRWGLPSLTYCLTVPVLPIACLTKFFIKCHYKFAPNSSSKKNYPLFSSVFKFSTSIFVFCCQSIL